MDSNECFSMDSNVDSEPKDSNVEDVLMDSKAEALLMDSKLRACTDGFEAQ